MNLLKKIFRRNAAEKTEERVMPDAPAVALETPVRHINLAEALRAAEAAVTEAQRKKRIFDQEMSAAITAATKAENDWNSGERQYFRDSKERQVREARGRVEALRTEASTVEKTLREAEAQLVSVRRQITEHPDYVAALAEQRKIVAEAREMASRAWSAPLFEIRKFVSRFDEAIDREDGFVRRSNAQLRNLGLPELHARLRNHRHALPLAIVDMNLNALWSEASRALQRLVDF